MYRVAAAAIGQFPTATRSLPADARTIPVAPRALKRRYDARLTLLVTERGGDQSACPGDRHPQPQGFPTPCPGSLGQEAKSADDFILDQTDLGREAVYSAVQRIADSRQNPPATFTDVLAMLERDGLVESAAVLRA